MVIDLNKKINEMNGHQHTEGHEAGGQVRRISLNAIRRPADLQVVDEKFEDDIPKAEDHAAEPIKNLEDIVLIQDYLISNGRYRDNLLFTVGINIGLRCGDLLNLKVGHLIDESTGAYRSKVIVQEEKTSKLRTLYWNEAVYDAADLYFSTCNEVSLNDYLFKCEGNRGKNLGKPLTRRSVERLLKEIINDGVGLDVHASTHCLRKTFAYHMIVSAPDRSRAIEFLQKILGHSRPSVTLRYAGITDDEIETAYKNLNLGNRNPFGWKWNSVSA